MAVSVALYANSYDRVRERLEALGLDLEIYPFRLDGLFHAGAKTIDPADVDLDYVWLSPELSLEGGLKKAFELVLKCRSIKLLQTFNAGLDAPAYRQIAARGIRICNSSAQSVAISEYVLGQVLGVFQPLAEQRALQAGKTWERTPFREIAGTSWLILGFGPIGQAIAQRAKAFGAHVSVVRRSPAPGPTVDRAGTLKDLPAFLPDTDVVVLACPLNESTRGLAGQAFFDALKPGAVLVNIARGGLIDDAAMIQALDDGRLAVAVLDVFRTEPLPSDDPFWAHPKIRLTSHTSFAGSGVRARWEQLFLDNLPRFVRGEALLHEVDPRDI
ncbi:MAG TPA: D-2-hydroxyacid dehydrogenase [Burkholderiales bacterium]|nr:D-2-hydroxyacid dehydrogenase [Burkholderiales bacterium]